MHYDVGSVLDVLDSVDLFLRPTVPLKLGSGFLDLDLPPLLGYCWSPLWPKSAPCHIALGDRVTDF